LYAEQIDIWNLKNIFHPRFDVFHYRINLMASFLVQGPKSIPDFLKSFKTLNQFDLIRPRTGIKMGVRILKPNQLSIKLRRFHISVVCNSRPILSPATLVD
jgi:hypothetical protein